MAGVHYEEVTCKSALNRVHGMPFAWSLNPYRGCVHGCAYCFARSTHGYFNLDAGRDFSSIIFVKVNVADVLAMEVARRGWRREQVAIGTATDPYQPIEGRYRLTRRCLETLCRFHTPASLVTKGTMIVRDIDVLRELATGVGVTVCFSVPTIDRDIWRRSEPGTPPPEQRLKVMARLVAGGVRAGVLMAPLLPGLSANPDQIERTVRAAAQHGACFIGSNVAHLGPGVREHFLAFLHSEYPQLLDTYLRLYGAKYAPKLYQTEIERIVQQAKAQAGYREHHHREVVMPPQPTQLALPLLGALSR